MSPLSEPIRQTIALLRMRRDDPARSGDMGARRAGFEIAMTPALMLAPSPVHQTVGGVACERLNADAPGGTLIYLHGGGYCVGSARTHRELAARLGRAAGRAVVVPDYRLAPEHPFPAGLEDAFSVYGAVLEADGPPPAVAGDSAGGGLALALAARVIAEGLAAPERLGLMSPWTDLTLSGASMVERAARDPFLSPAAIEAFARAYAGERDRADPLMSPLFAAFEGFPPVRVQVGSEEILFDDSARLVAGLKASGVDAGLFVGEGLFHVWQAVAPAPEAQAAVQALGDFLRRPPG